MVTVMKRTNKRRIQLGLDENLGLRASGGRWLQRIGRRIGDGQVFRKESDRWREGSLGRIKESLVVVRTRLQTQ